MCVVRRESSTELSKISAPCPLAVYSLDPGILDPASWSPSPRRRQHVTSHVIRDHLHFDFDHCSEVASDVLRAMDWLIRIVQSLIRINE